MITPLEIQKKEFKRSLGGYHPKSVESFLDEILVDYEALYKENIELKDKLNYMADQIRKYNTMEETLNKTLVVAQKTADEVTSAARQKAENIIDDAELRGIEIINDAKDEVRNIKTEYENLKKEIFTFKTRFQAFMEAQLLSLDEFYSQIEAGCAKETKDADEVSEKEKTKDIEEIENIEESNQVEDSSDIEA